MCICFLWRPVSHNLITNVENGATCLKNVEKNLINIRYLKFFLGKVEQPAL